MAQKNKQRPTRLKRAPRGDWYRKWYTWLIIGLLAAAGVIIAVWGATFTLTIVDPDQPQQDVFSVTVIDGWDGEALSDSNISYWNITNSGLADPNILSGKVSDAVMQSVNLPGEHLLKVEHEGYQTKWSDLSTTGPNVVDIWRLPTVNGSLSMIEIDDGSSWESNTTGNGRIKFWFPQSQNGTALESGLFDYENNETTYIIFRFQFNDTVNDTVIADLGQSAKINDTTVEVSVMHSLVTPDHEDFEERQLALSFEMNLPDPILLNNVQALYGVLDGDSIKVSDILVLS